MIQSVVAILIFLLTLTLVIWQPRGLGIGWSALGGAMVALATGVVRLNDIPTVVGIVWDATLAFIAVIIISLILDEVGFFEWAALHVAQWARGDRRRALVLIVLLGAVVAAFFANDGAALILTPIVYEMVVALKFERQRVLAFVLACGFIADTGSLPLVVSNLVNIVSADFFHIDFIGYVRVMLVPDLVSIAASIGVLLILFRREATGAFDATVLKQPREAIRDPRLFRIGWVVLGLVVTGYFAGALLHVPVSIVAGAGAIALFLAAQRSPAVNRRAVLRGAPWQIVLFSLGMYLVVYGLRNVGLTDIVSGVIAGLSQHGLVGGTVGTGFLIAVLSAVMNNMPTVLVGALSIAPVHVEPLTHQGLIFANIIGADLGPKFTPIGSLATLLWLHVLDRRGVRISWGQYFRTGILITPPVLLATLLALAGWLTVLGH